MAIPILGKIIDTVFSKGADLISEFITDKDKAIEFEHRYRIALLEDGQFSIEVEKDIYVAHQATIQAELQQNDTYTKRTRPIIARRSFYAGLAYALLTSLPVDGVAIPFTETVMMAWQFQWSVLMLLYSPALTYMGVRGLEKWKNGDPMRRKVV